MKFGTYSKTHYKLGITANPKIQHGRQKSKMAFFASGVPLHWLRSSCLSQMKLVKT